MIKMRKPRLILLLLAGLLALISCGERNSAMKEYKQFVQSHITLPERMIRIGQGTREDVVYKRSGRPLLVNYYGPEECSSCAVSHLRDNIKFLNMSQRDGNFDFIVIMAPPKEDREMVIERTLAMSLPLSVYIDDAYYMESLGVIPANASFHSFLLDAGGKPVFVGSPLWNESAKVRFQAEISKSADHSIINN